MEIKLLSFNTAEIMSCQQNRYPMLFVDRITECIPLKYAKGYKLFSYNEWYLKGYETKSPKVWTVVQIEAMSQVFLMTFLSSDDCRGYVAMSNKFSKVQFLRKIEPGEKLDLEAYLESFRHGIARGQVKGYVKGEIVCSMECTIIVPELFFKFKNSLPSNKVDKTSYQNSEALLNNFNQVETKKVQLAFGINKIKECLSKKDPWIFLDQVIDVMPGKFARVIKNFTFNEHFFPSHFPGNPNVPGFIQIECCIQAFLLTFLSKDKYQKRDTAEELLLNIQLKRKIVPGDTLEMFATLDSFSSGVAKGRVESYVDGEQAISFDITAVLVDQIS